LRNYGFGLKFNQLKRHLLAQRRKGRKENQIHLEIDTRTNRVKGLAPVTAWFTLRSLRALRETAFSRVIDNGRFARGSEKIYRRFA
jgi:hypothetical protein